MRVAHWTPLAIVVLVGTVLAGCGGGSSSATGPTGGRDGSAAAIQGQVLTTRSAASGESTVIVVLRKTLGIGLAEAANGAPLGGVSVRLLAGAQVIRTTTTDANGNFVFANVPPGTYTVQVWQGEPPVLVASTLVTVGAGDDAIIGFVSDGPPTVTVVARSTDVLNNEAQLGHAWNIAHASGSRCNILHVDDLRRSGHGWGRIARECGVHPRVIGLGHSNMSDAERAAARDEIGKGHGRGRDKNRGGKGPKKA